MVVNGKERKATGPVTPIKTLSNNNKYGLDGVGALTGTNT